MDREELTPPGHLKGLPSSLRPGECGIVVDGGVEHHVIGILDPGLEFGHDMVDPFFQEGPRSGEVSVCGRHRISGRVV